MKAWKIGAPLVLCLLSFHIGDAKPKKPDLPAVFQNARYIYVEAVDGDIFKPGLFLEDRRAIADVQDKVREWKRYAISINRNEADLVFVVRKGRLAAVEAHVGVSDGPRSQPRQPGQFPGQGRATEVGVRTEVGEPEDMLRVYIQNNGQLSAVVWDRTMEGGLNAPTVQLVKQLKDAVEKAYPPTPTNPPTKQP
jgi:hypothetical protein